jgi:hypothetical protein
LKKPRTSPGRASRIRSAMVISRPIRCARSMRKRSSSGPVCRARHGPLSQAGCSPHTTRKPFGSASGAAHARLPSKCSVSRCYRWPLSFPFICQRGLFSASMIDSPFLLGLPAGLSSWLTQVTHASPWYPRPGTPKASDGQRTKQDTLLGWVSCLSVFVRSVFARRQNRTKCKVVRFCPSREPCVTIPNPYGFFAQQFLAAS